MPSSPAGFPKSDEAGFGLLFPALPGRPVLSWPWAEFSEVSWSSWLDSFFRPVLLPHLVTVQNSATQARIREVVSSDSALSDKLPRDAMEPSILAGRELALHRPPQGDRVLKRLQATVDEGRTPGHFSTFYAVRAAAFSIPIQATLLSYLTEELRRALPEGNSTGSFLQVASRQVQDCLRDGIGLNGPALQWHG